MIVSLLKFAANQTVRRPLPGCLAIAPAMQTSIVSRNHSTRVSSIPSEDPNIDPRIPDVDDLGNPLMTYTSLKTASKADVLQQAGLYKMDMEEHLPARMISMLKYSAGHDIRKKIGHPIDLYEHGLQTATRAYHGKEDEEMIVVALLHDIGELFCAPNHGEIPAAMLTPWVAPERIWMLANHEVFQGYYYFEHVNADKNTREIYKDRPEYQMTIDFCEKYDQPAFDPDYETMPLSEFEPMLKRVLSRQSWWWNPNHPKSGAVTKTG
eukprot:GFYU01010184.1.p1 GENE.GFYU01010184.1~~GFYU01010184.1.p1  ORF type:complete len:284 (+),score=81.10 GFYU01010184.1:57-854(+)